MSPTPPPETVLITRHRLIWREVSTQIGNTRLAHCVHLIPAWHLAGISPPTPWFSNQWLCLRQPATEYGCTGVIMAIILSKQVSLGNSTKLNQTDASISSGVDNLLFDCARLEAGESLLIVVEDPKTGWWHPALGETLADIARSRGFSVQTMLVQAPGESNFVTITSAADQYDCTIFLARIGDQDRFAKVPSGKKRVVCYIRDLDMLCSDFARISFSAMQEIKKCVDQLLFSDREIRITCPLGTDLRGRTSLAIDREPADVSVIRFPVGIGAPVPALTFEGQVIMSGYLTPTGSRTYHPPVLKIDSPVTAKIKAGRILSFDGDDARVRMVERHYEHVSRTFDLEPYVIHSWHAGIHPGLRWTIKENADPDLWSNSVFNHPRYLHFHTCGDYAPGEISWMLRDHRVLIDDIPLWDAGWLKPENFQSTRCCLKSNTALAALYSAKQDKLESLS